MSEVASNTQKTAKAAWVKPELTRIAAGSAEQNNVGRPDGSTTPGTNQS